MYTKYNSPSTSHKDGKLENVHTSQKFCALKYLSLCRVLSRYSLGFCMTQCDYVVRFASENLTLSFMGGVRCAGNLKVKLR